MLHPDLLRRLCQARDRLRAEEDPPLSVTQIARSAGIAPHHFIRLCRAVFGETPHQLRAVARIERAKHLLILSEQSVTAVCMAVGFSSLGSFSTLFTRHTGLSPTVWRRRHRSAGLPPHLPPDFYPGCLTLMAGFPAEKAIFKKPAVSRSGKLTVLQS